ncbi:MAG: DUF2846 domain-containing protein [Tepidisphaeraceae bacterium]|jgi:hypothetical protein
MFSKMGSFKAILGFSLVAIAAACAHVQTMDSSADAQAKKFQPDAGMASIYFSRPSNGFGDTLVAQILLDGQMIGALAPNTYILESVYPGHHTLTVFGPTNSEQVDCQAIAGSNYFYNVTIVWAGPMIRHRHIEPMSDSDGRAAVSSFTRAVATTTNPT